MYILVLGIAPYIFQVKTFISSSFCRERNSQPSAGPPSQTLCAWWWSEQSARRYSCSLASWAERARGPLRARGCTMWSLVIALFLLFYFETLFCCFRICPLSVMWLPRHLRQTGPKCLPCHILLHLAQMWGIGTSIALYLDFTLLIRNI